MAQVVLRVNGEQREVPVGTTVAGLLASLGVAQGQAAIERNGEVVPRRLHAEQVLAEGDVIEVVTFVGGG